MSTTSEIKHKINEAEVSKLASQLWERAGRPAGRDLEFWLAAENQLKQAAKPAAAEVSKPSVKPTAPVTPPSAPVVAAAPRAIPSALTVSAGASSQVRPKPVESKPVALPPPSTAAAKPGKNSRKNARS